MNTVTISTTLAIAFVCMIIGFVTGGFIGMRNKDKTKKKSEEPSDSVPASNGQSPAPLADPAKYTELLRLWREKHNNGLFVETSGHLLASSQPLNAAQKKRFIDLIKELADWLNIPVMDFMAPIPETLKSSSQPVPPATVVEAVHPVETAPEQPPQPHVIKASEAVKTDPLPSSHPAPPVPAIPNPAVEVQNAAPPPVSKLPPQPAVRPATEPAKKPGISMVEQIDDILQEIIQYSDNPSRRVKLVEERQDGVVVWVGQERFVGIDAVTDQSAKELVRAAVKEWDRRTENRG